MKENRLEHYYFAEGKQATGRKQVSAIILCMNKKYTLQEENMLKHYFSEGWERVRALILCRRKTGSSNNTIQEENRFEQ